MLPIANVSLIKYKNRQDLAHINIKHLILRYLSIISIKIRILPLKNSIGGYLAVIGFLLLKIRILVWQDLGHIMTVGGCMKLWLEGPIGENHKGLFMGRIKNYQLVYLGLGLIRIKRLIPLVMQVQPLEANLLVVSWRELCHKIQSILRKVRRAS